MQLLKWINVLLLTWIKVLLRDVCYSVGRGAGLLPSYKKARVAAATTASVTGSVTSAMPPQRCAASPLSPSG